MESEGLRPQLRNLRTAANGGYSNMENPFRQVSYGESLRHGIEQIRFGFERLSSRGRELAIRARVVGQIQRVIEGTQRRWIAIGAYMDAMKISYTSRLSEEFSTGHTFDEMYCYALCQRRGMTKEESWQQVEDMTQKRIAEAQNAQNETSIIITTEMITKPEKMINAVKRSFQEGQLLVFDAKTEQEEIAINEAVGQTMAVLGLDQVYKPIPIGFLEFTPYNIIDLGEKIDSIQPWQVDQLRPILKELFDQMKNGVDELKPLLRSTMRTNRLSVEEKTDLITEVLNVVGCPQEELTLVIESLEQRRSGEDIELSPVVEAVKKTTFVLERLEGKLGVRFAQLVAEVSSTTDSLVLEMLTIFEETLGLEGVTARTLFATSGRGFWGTVGDLAATVCLPLGLNHPYRDLDQFLNHIAERIRDFIWIKGLAIGHAIAFGYLSKFAFGRTPGSLHLFGLDTHILADERFLYFVNHVIPLLMLGETIPVTDKASISLQKILSRIPFLKDIQVSEALGIGVSPMKFGRFTPVGFRPYRVDIGGKKMRSLVADKKRKVLFYASNGNALPVQDATGTALGLRLDGYIGPILNGPIYQGPRLLNELEVAVNVGKVTSHIPETYLCVPIPGIFIRFPILASLHERFLYHELPWKLSAHGIEKFRDRPRRRQLYYGLVQIIAAFITKKIYVYKDADEALPLEELTAEAYESKDMPRTFFEKEKDFISSLLNIFIQLTIVRWMRFAPVAYSAGNVIAHVPIVGPVVATVPRAIGDPHVHQISHEALPRLWENISYVVGKGIVGNRAGPDTPNPLQVEPGTTPSVDQNLLNSMNQNWDTSNLGRYLQHSGLTKEGIQFIHSYKDGTVIIQLNDGRTIYTDWTTIKGF